MHKLTLMLLALAITSCGQIINPVTTVPAAMLGAYNKINKRETLLEYAKKGDVYSQYELANSYCCADFEGKTSHKASFKWYCEAAINGSSKAQIELGKLFENRKKFSTMAIAKDDEMAYMWYSFAAKRASSQGIRLKKLLAKDLSLEQKQRAKEYIRQSPDEAKNSCRKFL